MRGWTRVMLGMGLLTLSLLLLIDNQVRIHPNFWWSVFATSGVSYGVYTIAKGAIKEHEEAKQ